MSAIVVAKDDAAEVEVAAKGLLQTIGDALQALLDERDAIIHETYESQEDLKAFKQHNIPDQVALELTQEITADLKLNLKAVQARKERATKPINTLLRLIHEIYRPLLTNLESGELELKQKMAKALKRMKDEQTKALSAVAAATRAGDMEAAKRVMDTIPEASLPKNMSVRELWKFKVLDTTKVPDDYLMIVVNDGAVQAAIDAGVREIPGLEIYQDDSVTIRQGKK